MRAALGHGAAELGQLFPQLAEESPATSLRDPAQAKLRLFESVVALLESLGARSRVAARARRHPLGGRARRASCSTTPPDGSPGSRVMLLATHRSDELDRRHPLTAQGPGVARAGLAETVTVSAMSPGKVAEMIAVDPGCRPREWRAGGLVAPAPRATRSCSRRCCGRRSTAASVRTESGWGRVGWHVPDAGDRSRGGAPSSGRLDAEHIDVLRAAAVLGRAFDYGLFVRSLRPKSGSFWRRSSRLSAQQLLEEAAGARRALPLAPRAHPGGDRGRHGRPEAAGIHSRAADALLEVGRRCDRRRRPPARSGPDARGRRACLDAADEAERAVGSPRRPRCSSGSCRTYATRVSGRSCSRGWGTCAG